MFGKTYSFYFFFLVQIGSLIWARDVAKKSKSDVKVVVVGAGPAGLHSAYKLAEAGVENIVVLEANHRLGGRINSVPINGDWIEFGAQWIHGEGENPLWKFVEDNEILVNPDTAEGGEGIFIRDDGKIIPKEIKDATDKALEGFRKKCSSKAADKPDSVGDYLTRSFKNWLATSKPNDDAATTAWRKQLFQWTMKLENFDSAADNLFNQSAISWCSYKQIERDRSFMNGYQSLINYWRDSLSEKGVDVRLNTKVTKILWQNSDGTVTVQTENGDSFEADHVILTVSLGYLQQHQSGLFYPQLPEDKVKVINTLKFGTTDKIFLEFEEDFWDETGIQFLWTGDELDTTKFDKKNWVHYVIGFDVVQNQPNMLVGWMAGLPAKYMETLSDEEIKKGILEHLTKVMRNYKNDQEYQLPALKLIKPTRWHSDPLFLGSYSYRETDSDILGITHSDLADPLLVDEVPRVLFAGEATSEHYYSAVHGAMDSARREVEKNILEYLSSE